MRLRPLLPAPATRPTRHGTRDTNPLSSRHPPSNLPFTLQRRGGGNPPLSSDSRPVAVPAGGICRHSVRRGKGSGSARLKWLLRPWARRQYWGRVRHARGCHAAPARPRTLRGSGAHARNPSVQHARQPPCSSDSQATSLALAVLLEKLPYVVAGEGWPTMLGCPHIRTPPDCMLEGWRVSRVSGWSKRFCCVRGGRLSARGWALPGSSAVKAVAELALPSLFAGPVAHHVCRTFGCRERALSGRSPVRGVEGNVFKSLRRSRLPR